MKNILFTGGTGFVGLNLNAYLSDKNFVISELVRQGSNKRNKIAYNDFTNNHLEDTFAFIHLAGKAHDLKKTSEDAAYFEVNTELTKKLYDQFLVSDCEVFIYMSSVKAAADTVEKFLTEEVTPNPITAYGRSKLAAENYILSKEIPDGKRVYILRPCMIHGPNNKGNLNLLYNVVSKRIPYPFGRYKNQRSFVSIDNLCFIINKLLDKTNIKSGIYNIADDKPLSTKDLVTLIGNEINKPAIILNFPKGLIKLIAKIGDTLSLPINTERVEKLTENYEVSNNKIKEALYLKELPLAAEVGMRKTINSFNKK